MGPRSWLRWPMGSANRLRRGPTCSAPASVAVCAPRCWRLATVRLGSGRRSARCFPRPRNNAAGGTRWATSWPRCLSPPSPAHGLPWPRSTTPRARNTPARQSRCSRTSTEPSGPRPSPRSPTTSTCSSRSTTSPPSTGSTYGPRTRSSPRSPPSGFGPGSPRGPAPGPPASRWRSTSSSPHKPDGERSTHLTSSHWSEPEPYSRTANSSNDPTSQVVISKSRETHQSTSLEHSSALGAHHRKVAPGQGTGQHTDRGGVRGRQCRAQHPSRRPRHAQAVTYEGHGCGGHNDQDGAQQHDSAEVGAYLSQGGIETLPEQQHRQEDEQHDPRREVDAAGGR